MWHTYLIMHQALRRIRPLRVLRTSLRVGDPFTSAQQLVNFARRVCIERSSESPSAFRTIDTAKETSQGLNRNSDLFTCISDPNTTYYVSLEAFSKLRIGNLKLKESLYLSLLYKALREGHHERVWDGYEEFLKDETRGKVDSQFRARTTWPTLSNARLQMHRFVLWAMLDTHRKKAMEQYYQREVVGKYNQQGIHEADSLNFLLRMECTSKVTDEQEQGLRHRVETLLTTLEQFKLHTSYSSTHALVRLIVHRPEIFVMALAGKEKAFEAGLDAENKATGQIIVGYFERFPYAMALESKRISIAISVAAAAGQHDAAKQLLQYGLNHRVPIDVGSFAHAVEGAPDDTIRLNIVDLYVDAKERELVCANQGSNGSIINYLLYHAILDGNFKHSIELLHEMQLNNNVASNRTVRELFKSVAKYRAHSREEDDRGDDYEKMSECPTIMELLNNFSNVIPRTVHSLSQGILQTLYAGELNVALDLMRVARYHDVKLRPEIYSQLLYPLLAGGQRGGGEASNAGIFDRLEVEQCFDSQYPEERTFLNSLIINICQSNDDFSTMLVCLDRWQAQGHPPLSRRVMKRVFEVISKRIRKLQKENGVVKPGTVFVVDGMKLSFLAFLVRYCTIMTWDSWTIERAIVRARTSGLYADVVTLLTEANSRGLMLSSTAYIVSLCVLEEVGDPFAVLACVKAIKANEAWAKVVKKDPKVQEILNRAIVKSEKGID